MAEIPPPAGIDSLSEKWRGYASDISRVISDYRWASLEGFQEDTPRIKAHLVFEVALPSRFRSRGVTDSGVRAIEPVTLIFFETWPYSAPRVALRADFNRDLPHINPWPNPAAVYPCLAPGGHLSDVLHDGDGLYAVLRQVKDWLDRAAREGLYDEYIGWEPVIAPSERGTLKCDIGRLQPVDAAGGVKEYLAVFAAKDDWCHAQLLEDCRYTLPKDPRLDDEGVGTTTAFLHWGESTSTSTLRQLAPVSSLLGVYELAAIGKKKGFLRSAVNRLIKAHAASGITGKFSFFILLALWRPVPLTGSDTNAEVLPFWITYDLDLGERGEKTATAAFIQHRQKLTRRLASQMSGVEPAPPGQSVTMIGCGSLGSKIALHLAKAGVGPQGLIDDSDFKPHNAVRHGLTPKPAIGRNKAELLAETLKDIDAPASAYAKSVITMMNAGDGTLADSIIINTTASSRVRESLATAAHIGRVVSASFHAAGKAAHLLIEGEGRNPRIDDLHAWMLDSASSSKRARALLFARDVGFRPHPVGQGCTSLTMVMSDADASLHAASIGRRLISWLSERPQEGEVWLGLPDNSGIGVEWHPQYLGKTMVGNSGSWEIRILQPVVDQMAIDANHHHPLESGGPLVGHINAHLKRITVTRALAAPEGSVRKRTYFKMSTTGLRQTVRQVQRESSGFLNFLGTWHSHTCDCPASPTDYASLLEFAMLRGGPPFLMLIKTPSNVIALVKESLSEVQEHAAHEQAESNLS